jgi:GNAT superfamily N-acetyltransferase
MEISRVSDQVSFRRATRGDFEAVLGLASQLALHIEEDIPPLTRERFCSCYVGDAAPMHLLLALRAGHIVGMIAWTLTHELYSGHARVYISDLSVDQTARGHGVGGALMAQVKTWARAHSAHKLAWEIWRHNHTAKAFYKSMGAQIDEGAIPFVVQTEDLLA